MMRQLLLFVVIICITRMNTVKPFSSQPPLFFLSHATTNLNIDTNVARRRRQQQRQQHPYLQMMEERDMANNNSVNDSSSPTTTTTNTNNNNSFRMVYTCNKCETRNMVQIQRQVWEEGVVIATCQGCGVKHLLADNQGLLNIGDAYNAVEDAEKKNGGAGGNNNNNNNIIHRLTLDPNNMDDEKTTNDLLSEFDLTTDEKGNIQLLPRPGDTNIIMKDKVSATGPAVDAIDTGIQQPELASMMGDDDDDNDDSSSQARMDSYGDGGSFDIDIPDGIEAGDLLQLGMENGQIMMLPVPEQLGTTTTTTNGSSSVKVLGAIEFAIPNGKTEGDVVILKTPAGDTVPIKIPPGVTEGSFLKVAYPVELNE